MNRLIHNNNRMSQVIALILFLFASSLASATTLSIINCAPEITMKVDYEKHSGDEKHLEYTLRQLRYKTPDYFSNEDGKGSKLSFSRKSSKSPGKKYKKISLVSSQFGPEDGKDATLIVCPPDGTKWGVVHSDEKLTATSVYKLCQKLCFDLSSPKSSGLSPSIRSCPIL